MQTRQLKRYWAQSLLLALVSIFAGVTLLLLSGWFISACALAGLSTAALTFNYVVPSAAIRLLTFTRIMSSYGEKYFGHDALLRHMNALRLRVFGGVMAQSATTAKAEEMERVVNDTHHLSNRFLAVVNPLISAVLLVVGLAVFVGLMLTAMWGVFAFGMLAITAVFVWRFRCAIIAAKRAKDSQTDYRKALSQHLSSASIWSLNPKKHWSDAAQSRFVNAQQTLRQCEYNSDWWVLALSLIGILAALLWLPASLLGQPILVCLPLLFLAFPEWLGQVVRALIPEAHARQAKQHLRNIVDADFSTNQSQAAVFNGKLQSLQLKQFQWCRSRYRGQPVDLHCQLGDVIWLNGSSGSGKSSLMMAMAGLIPSAGGLHINNDQALTQTQLAALTPTQAVYSEQFPQILLDTLRQNLVLAKPNASDEELMRALHFAALDNLAADGLDQWLGPQGRQLSGGEQKRLGLARAYLSGASVWLLDEPFAAQDDETVQRLVKALREQGGDRMVFVASHWVPEGVGFSGRLELG